MSVQPRGGTGKNERSGTKRRQERPPPRKPSCFVNEDETRCQRQNAHYCTPLRVLHAEESSLHDRQMGMLTFGGGEKCSDQQFPQPGCRQVERRVWTARDEDHIQRKRERD